VERNWRRAAWGVALIVLGLLILGDRFGYLPGRVFSLSWWGAIVVFLGAVALINPRRAGDVGNGVSFIGFGIWCLLATTGAYGFTWGNSWPLALVAVGAGTVAHAIAARWLPDTPRLRRRDRHVESV
jgi:hypothetical protein